ncbi:MAG TPA: hypothetical protein VGN97_20380 [Mesorhizobium sp.]|nr:hypothetical protein [Mesorhizobium sp.]
MAEILNVEFSPELIEELAEALHAELERLDPTEDEFWHDLSGDRREFYRQCVSAILRKLDARWPGYISDDDPVIGSARAVGLRTEVCEEPDAAKDIGGPVELPNTQG